MAAEPRRPRSSARQLWSALIFVVVVMLAHAHVVLSDTDKVCHRDDNVRSRGVCGKALADMVSAVCRHYGGRVNKRLADIDYVPVVDDGDYQSSASAFGEGQGRGVFGAGRGTTVDLELPAAFGAIFLPKSVALTHFRSSRDVAMATDGSGAAPHVIRRRGIVCECCVHQCSISELRQYCTPPADYRKRSVVGPFYRPQLLQLASPSLYQQHRHHQHQQQVGGLDALPLATAGDQLLQPTGEVDDHYGDAGVAGL